MVTAQPTVYSSTVPRQTQPETGIIAIILAVFATFCVLSFGCWWALPCTIIGIVLGVTVSHLKPFPGWYSS